MAQVLLTYDLDGFQTEVKNACKADFKFHDAGGELPDTTLLRNVVFSDKARQYSDKDYIEFVENQFIKAVQSVADDNNLNSSRKAITITSLALAVIKGGKIATPHIIKPK